MDFPVLVCVELGGEQHLVGRLWSRVRSGRESATFEYDGKWLASPLRFSIEPALKLTPGPFHTGMDNPFFGALGDSAPDRWGRMLMRNAERRRAELQKETPRTLYEIDYLLMVDDHARQGALRFVSTADGAFLTEYRDRKIPPLLELPKLLSATEHVLNQKHTDEDLRLLLAPGSSLGGARPKASVRDSAGQLLIAKFPSKGDEVNTIAWESVALSLAANAGITIPEWTVHRVGGYAQRTISIRCLRISNHAF